MSGAVVVTTPQQLAAADAERAIALFHEHDIPVFGIVENMAGYICPCCGERQDLFTGPGARDVAARAHVAVLGSVPLDPAAQADADSGTPLVLANSDTPAAAALTGIARLVLEALTREQRARTRRANDRASADSAAFWEDMIDG